MGLINRKQPLVPGTVVFGDAEEGTVKHARVRKLTAARINDLNAATSAIPTLVLHVVDALQSEDFKSYMVTLVNEMLDEIVKIIASLSGLDEEYVHENVGIDQMVEYLVKTFEKNDFDAILKNVKSLLPKIAE